jgi:hypothetical protein
MVSVSKHFYVTQNGKYKKQNKAFEVKLNKPNTFTKKHVINYMIRDHFSGLFYAEITDTENFIPISEFLYRAWSKKNNHSLCGMPLGVSIPQSVQNKWPNLVSSIEQLGILPITVTSGFQGGIRDIRTWEEYLRSTPYKSGYPPNYKEVLSNSEEICQLLNTASSGKMDKTTMWKENLAEEILYPPNLIAFKAIFKN